MHKQLMLKNKVSAIQIILSAFKREKKVPKKREYFIDYISYIYYNIGVLNNSLFQNKLQCKQK